MKKFIALVAIMAIGSLAFAQDKSFVRNVQIDAPLAPADNVTNPSKVEGNFCYMAAWDGSTWDRYTGAPVSVATEGVYVEDAAETAGGNLQMAGCVVRAGKTGSTATAADNATCNVTTEGGLWGASDQIEDAAETAATPLAMCGAVRRDTAASSAGTTGDNATINTDATGHLWVMPNVLTVAGTTAVVEDAGETAAGNLLPLGAVRRDTAASSGGTTGDNVTLNTDATGHMWVMPNILTVAGTTAVVEDAAETAAGNLVPIASVRRDLLVSSAGTTGDNATLNTSGLGSLWTEEATRAVAYGSSPAAVAAGVYGAPIADLEGRPYVNTSHPRAIHCGLHSTTATTATQLTGCEVVASNSYYVTAVTVSGDAANATATPWKLISGTSTDCTGATVVLSGWHAATTTATMTFPTPIKVTQAHGLCILSGETGSKSMTVTGYIAP